MPTVVPGQMGYDPNPQTDRTVSSAFYDLFASSMILLSFSLVVFVRRHRFNCARAPKKNNQTIYNIYTCIVYTQFVYLK